MREGHFPLQKNFQKPNNFDNATEFREILMSHKNPNYVDDTADRMWRDIAKKGELNRMKERDPLHDIRIRSDPRDMKRARTDSLLNDGTLVRLFSAEWAIENTCPEVKLLNKMWADIKYGWVDAVEGHRRHQADETLTQGGKDLAAGRALRQRIEALETSVEDASNIAVLKLADIEKQKESSLAWA